jgi:hypothetical protein
VAGGQGKDRLVPQGGDDGCADGLPQQRLVTIARHAVQDHAGQRQARAKARKAVDEGGGGLCLVAAVEGEEHGKTEERCKVGGRAFRAARPVEQSHDAFDDDEVRARREIGGEAADECRAHGPRIEIIAGPARRGLMEARVDVVGPRLGGGHAKPMIAEGPQQAQRDQCLAAAGGGGRHHDGPWHIRIEPLHLRACRERPQLRCRGEDGGGSAQPGHRTR